MKQYAAGEKHPVSFVLNGRAQQGWCEPRMLLSDFLRHEIGATGTHVGCEHGVCGACTVLINDQPARACLTFAVQMEAARIDTVEGLHDESGGLTDLQQAFRRHHALQCGFCTSGMLMSCEVFLRHTPHPDEKQVREMLSGHLCRCTGYAGIVKAILEVAASRGEERHA